MVIQAMTAGDKDLADHLKKQFGFKGDLVLRAEHVFYHELVKLVPQLTSLRRVLDESVLSKLLGKTKSLEDPRPDYFHLNEVTNIALHGEFDEKDDHEEDERRLRVIAHHAGCSADRVYYFRVKACLGRPQALCQRVLRKEMAYYQMTERGREVLEEVANYVRWCLERMDAGEPPSPSSTQCLAVEKF